MTDSPLTPLREDILRDYLSQRLELIEPNLSLVDTEYALKNESGAGGFIDILARDVSGDLVVVELKRLDQSARQALHELEKYVALLAADKGVRVDRLRCVVLSTTWHELLVPFARFVTHADFHASGRLIILGDDGYPIRTDPVMLPPTESGLEVCPLHISLLYTTKERRDAASPSVIAELADIPVHDYITVDLNYSGPNPNVIYPFAHYLVFGEFPESLRDLVRGKFPDDCEDEPEDNPWWHEEVVQSVVVGAVSRDSAEVGSPEKFGGLDGWQVVQATGHGRYDDPQVWTRNELLQTVAAAGEQFSMPFMRRVTVANHAAWSRFRRNFAHCLLGAGQWPDVFGAVLDEIEERPTAEVVVSAYVPCDLLTGLERLVRTGTDDCLPKLTLRWEDGETGALVGGRLQWDGVTRVTSVSETVGAVFDDFFDDYVIAVHFGEQWEFESELCELHGLSYDVGESVFSSESATLERLTIGPDGKLIRTPMSDDEPSGQEFVDAHREYLKELVATFDRHIWRA